MVHLTFGEVVIFGPLDAIKLKLQLLCGNVVIIQWGMCQAVEIYIVYWHDFICSIGTIFLYWNRVISRKRGTKRFRDQRSAYEPITGHQEGEESFRNCDAVLLHNLRKLLKSSNTLQTIIYCIKEC